MDLCKISQTMLGGNVLTVFIGGVILSLASKNVERSQPVIQRTVEAFFTTRSQITYPESCKIFTSSPRQSRMCTKDPMLPKILEVAKNQAIDSCEESFQYDRWNCSLVFNRKRRRSIFNKLYRETAFVYALIAASLTHVVARGCASGELSRCGCAGSSEKATSVHWKRSGCDDDFIFGKKFTRNFLDIKHSGNDQFGETLKRDVIVGINSVRVQLKEVCKCHGFSGSCTTKTCWKTLGPFNSVLGSLKRQYHHAVRNRIVNDTAKISVHSTKKKLKLLKNKLVYLQKTPNLCVSTKGRKCRDRDNCATLCCGRGYEISKMTVNSRCKCRMVGCCFVECETCTRNVDIFTCK